MTIMVCSHCARTGHGPGMGSMGSDMLRRNVHTGPILGQGPGPIASYFASPVPFMVLGPGPDPVQCADICALKERESALQPFHDRE